MFKVYIFLLIKMFYGIALFIAAIYLLVINSNYQFVINMIEGFIERGLL